MEEKIKAVLYRFLRGFVAGAVSATVVMVPLSVGTWGEFYSWVSTLTIAFLTGGLSGGIMAIDKYLRFEE